MKIHEILSIPEAFQKISLSFSLSSSFFALSLFLPFNKGNNISIFK